MPGRPTVEDGIPARTEPPLARLAVGYVVSAAAMTGAELIYEALQDFLLLYRDNFGAAAASFRFDLDFGLWIGGLLLVLSLPFAWIPLWLVLLACRKFSIPPFIACLFAGVVVMLIFKLVRPLFLPSLDLTWTEALAESLRMLVVGSIAGLVFWAICYRALPRSSPRFAEALAKLS